MKPKTFKGKLKKAGLYTLCYSPVALMMGCLGLGVGGGAVAIKYENKRDDIYNNIYSQIFMTEQFQEYKADKEEKLFSALKDGSISIDEFTKKSKEITNENNVIDYAKNLPEFSAQIELAQQYDDKYNKWVNSLWALLGFGGFGVTSALSLVYANSDMQNIDFDKEKDIEKQKKRLQAKQEKLAKKEKAL